MRVYRIATSIITFILAFLLPTIPALADIDSGLALSVTEIQIFTVNNVAPLTYTYSNYSDYGTPQDLGDINYDLQANSAWQVEGRIFDNESGGQNANDWDDGSWKLTVNGIAINETTDTVIDSGGGPVARDDALWEVLLTIPWPESAASPDCRLLLTASNL